MEPLQVTGTTFYPKDNAKESHTEEYDLTKLTDIPTPILRRGCNFYFAVRFNREYDEKNDVIRVRLMFGPKPTVVKGTKVVLKVHPNKKHFPKDPNKWDVQLRNHSGTDGIIQVHIPPFVPVGIWKCAVECNIAGQREPKTEFVCPEDIYIIFNPWCKEDSVYMENEQERKEYILNEHGKIWCGTFKKPKGKPWIFGQFDDIALPAAVLLLEKSGLAYADRGSPVLISRAISAVINSVDDDGLLVGRWDGEYSDGTSPYDWTGSSAILDAYLSSGCQPVKYGQCWIFSAATVTICRALGIPCRSVTNYVSAHDTNCSLTVDKYFDLQGNKIENGPEGDCNDSCWNFHVWNDVWMARQDLPAGYGGWQIIDATPQEQSGSVYRCGPASIAAVRRGEIGFVYDTPFVFSEVNADIVHFKEDLESDWGFSKLSINKYHVGRKILTKRIDVNDDEGDSDMWDVTDFYKNQEGTEAERLAVYNAVKGVPKALQLYEMPSADQEDVFFDLIDIDSVPYGEEFVVTVKIINNSQEERTVAAWLSASSIFYNGDAGDTIKKAQGIVKVNAGQEETLKIHVSPKEYIEKLVEHGFVKMYAIANVKETKQTWSEEDDFIFTMPDITIRVADCKVGEECPVEFRFQNPLSLPLTKCTYTFEGPGLQRPKIAAHRDVQPKEEVVVSEKFVAKRTGERKIVARFNSKEIKGIEGCTKVVVHE